MTTTPELDRALKVAKEATRDAYYEAFHPEDYLKAHTEYAQALIAELLNSVKPPPYFNTSEENGFAHALHKILHIAGIVESEE